MKRLRDSDSGASLVELLVGIALLLMVTGIVADTIVNALRVQTRLGERTSDLDDTRAALQRTTRDVRDLSRVDGASGTGFAAQRDTDAGPVLLSWSLRPPSGSSATTALVLTTTSPSGATSTSVVLPSVDPTTAVWTYQPRSGYTPRDPTTVDASTCLIVGSNPPAYAPQCIGTVGVRLRVPARVGVPTELTDTVTLRNVAAQP